MEKTSTRQTSANVLRLMPSLVILGRRERWCARCGESTLDEGPCPRCAGTQFVDPRRLLRPGEYIVI